MASGLVLFAVCAVAAVTNAQEPVQRSIRITSDPAGAEICETVEGKSSCLGYTPASLQLAFRSSTSAKRLHLSRVGYKTARLIVTSADSVKSCNLEPRDVYVDISPSASTKEKEVFAFINDKIRNLFFSPQPAKGLHGFEFLGRFNVQETDKGKFSVIVPIMVEDSFRTKYISKIDRDYPAERRANETANALWQEYAGSLASVLLNAFSRNKNIENVVVLASYSRVKFTLEDEDYAFIATSKVYTGSYTKGSGEWKTQVDTYQVTKFAVPYGYTTIASSIKVYTVAYIIPTTNSFHRPSETLSLNGVSILSNDNRTNKFLEIER
jgi:hypothetical protein